MNYNLYRRCMTLSAEWAMRRMLIAQYFRRAGGRLIRDDNAAKHMTCIWFS